MNNEFYMRRCIDLAQLGSGLVAPNPMVGSVIVYNDKIIGEGFHKEFGGNHAEVNAILAVKDKSLLKKATIYVNLEPCSHFGKTPPCADLLIHHQFKKIVIACKDVNLEVAGKGIEKLKAAGIEVVLGVLEKEALALNKRFFTFHSKKRPYIILKWAQTKDGFIDKLRSENDKNSINWISSPETQTIVHQWRSEEQAILVGRKTIENDNPSLTVRNVKGKNPIKVILDPNIELKSLNYSIFNDTSARILILNKTVSKQIGNIKYIKINTFNLKEILHSLFKENILSVLVEGGKITLQHFVAENFWDEMRVIEGNTFFKSGLKAPKIDILPTKIDSFSKDKIYHYFCK